MRRFKFIFIAVVSFYGCAAKINQLAFDFDNVKDNAAAHSTWITPNFFSIILDDLDTTFPFDLATWVSLADGKPSYLDVVDKHGEIKRYSFDKYAKKKWKYVGIFPITSFTYIHIIKTQKRVPQI